MIDLHFYFLPLRNLLGVSHVDSGRGNIPAWCLCCRTDLAAEKFTAFHTVRRRAKLTLTALPATRVALIRWYVKWMVGGHKRLLFWKKRLPESVKSKKKNSLNNSHVPSVTQTYITAQLKISPQTHVAVFFFMKTSAWRFFTAWLLACFLRVAILSFTLVVWRVEITSVSLKEGSISFTRKESPGIRP